VRKLRRVQLLSETDSGSVAIHTEQEGENDGPRLLPMTTPSRSAALFHALRTPTRLASVCWPSNREKAIGGIVGRRGCELRNTWCCKVLPNAQRRFLTWVPFCESRWASHCW